MIACWQGLSRLPFCGNSYLNGVVDQAGHREVDDDISLSVVDGWERALSSIQLSITVVLDPPSSAAARRAPPVVLHPPCTAVSSALRPAGLDAPCTPVSCALLDRTRCSAHSGALCTPRYLLHDCLVPLYPDYYRVGVPGVISMAR